MARDLQSIVKMSRREGYALHPKAHKALVKRTAPPGGMNSGRPAQKSQYNIQLREKQKVKRLYGLLEKQFVNLMKEASKKQGSTGELLLQFLEQRLDNALYKSGFSTSRRGARQLVTHGHFMLNDRRVDIPSIRLKVGDKIVIRDSSKSNNYFKNLDDLSPPAGDIPSWLTVDRKKLQITVTGLPSREEAEPDINEQLIV